MILKLCLLLPKLLDLALEIRNTHLGNMRLSVAKHQTSLVKSLISRKCHFQVITNPHQENTPLRQIHSSLSYDLIEQFIVNLLSNRTYPTLSSLLLDQFGLKCLFQLLQLASTGFSLAYIKPIIDAISFENVRLKHFVQKLGILRIKR